MFNISNNKQGTAYLGLIIAVLIIAGMATGGFYLSSKRGDNAKDLGDIAPAGYDSPFGAVKALNQAKEDIDDINGEQLERNDIASSTIQ